MTINFYDAGNGDGLFDILGKAFHAQSTANTARGTTVPAQVDDIYTQINNLASIDPDYESIAGRLPAAVAGFQSAGGSLLTSIRQFCQDFLIEFVSNDVDLPDRKLSTALQELIDQMESESESVDASTVGLSVAYGGGNTGNGALVTSTKRGDGRIQESIVAEVLSGEFLASGLTAAVRFKGEEAAGSKLDHDWPKGSGITVSVAAIDAASSLLANGDMEDEDDIADMPDDWYASVGTIGTTIKMTNPEQQTIIIASDPTTGYYRVLWTTPGGDAVNTTWLPYNATGSQLQTALRLLPGLSAVTVVTTGDSPNFTHTITFTGLGGNVAEFTSENGFDTGTISHNTTVAGSANVFAGSKAMELDSDGAQLTTIQQPVAGLTTKTAYAVSLWALADVVPAAGVITIDLVDGIGGTVIQDAQGVNNSFTIDCTGLTTSWQHLVDIAGSDPVFRTPAVLPDVVYFRIRISTAVSSGTSVFIDHVAMAKMTALYAGGPLIANFSGSVEWKKGDTATITATSNRAGLIQEWMERNFGMAALGLILPSDTGGSETIPDTVVA